MSTPPHIRTPEEPTASQRAAAALRARVDRVANEVWDAYETDLHSDAKSEVYALRGAIAGLTDLPAEVRASAAKHVDEAFRFFSTADRERARYAHATLGALSRMLEALEAKPPLIEA
jgi:hypothetical protein